MQNNLDEFRERLNAFRDNALVYAGKMPYLATEKLCALYKKLGNGDRAMANTVIAEWALSDDEGTRYDALLLIRDFRITDATAPLQMLARRLALGSGPAAKYELEKVQQLLKDLAEPN